MRKMMLTIIAAIACAVSAGCVVMPPGAQYSYENSPPVMTADNTSGLVFFLRESSFTGGGAGYYIQEDDKNIGLLSSGSYFIHRTIPGKHTYLAADGANSAVTLDIQPGQTYYMLSWIAASGIFTAQTHLKEIPASVAKKRLPELKYLRMLN